MTRRTFHLIPHTHWDREWYRTRAELATSLVVAVHDLVEALEDAPAGRFVADGQAVLLTDAITAMPSLESALATLVREGRLDAGPWYVLADELMPSGESLIRNLAIGREITSRWGGSMPVCYSPDAFGHPAMLPAIAAGFGLDAGVVWRGLAPDERGDVDLRTWRAPDGSSLLVLHLPPAGYEIGASLASDAPREWPAIRDLLAARAATEHVAVPVGADHHAPPRDMTALRDAIAAAAPGSDVRLSTFTEYFACVRPRGGALAGVEGELRWSHGHAWNLQGVHATRSRLKRLHAHAELRLQRHAEPLAALASVTSPHGTVALTAVLDVAWRALVESQFHDTLAGTCSDAVAQEQRVRLDGVVAMAVSIGDAARARLLDHDADRAREGAAARPTLVCWNPVARTRGGIVVTELSFFRRDVLVGPPDGRVARAGDGAHDVVLEGAGGALAVEVLERHVARQRLDAARHYPDLDEVDVVRVAVSLPPVRGCGFRAFTTRPSHLRAEGRVEAHPRTLRNPFVDVRLDDDGTLTVADHRSGETYRQLLRLVDECDCGDAYTPWIRPDVAPTTAGSPLSHAVHGGTLVASLEAGWTLHSAGSGELTCRLTVTLHADSPVIRLAYDIDNAADDHRLRAVIPVGSGSEAIAGAPFTAERRAPVPPDVRDPRETPVRTAPAQRFVAAGAGSRGLVVLAPGSFEYEWTPAQELIVTLLRSVGELSRDTLPTRPGHAAWPVAIPGAQEHGHHRIELALVPADSGDLASVSALETMWEDAFLPIATTFVPDFCGDATVAEAIGVTLHGDDLVMTAMAPARSCRGLVLRCRNASPRAVKGAWDVRMGVARARLVRLDETPIAALDVAAGRIAFDAPPHALVTVLLELLPA